MSHLDELFYCECNPTFPIFLYLSKYIEDYPKLINVTKFSEKKKKEILNFSPTKNFPLLHTGDYFITGTFPIVNYILNNNESVKEILLGKNLRNTAIVESWCNFINNNLCPITLEIYNNLHGKKPFNENNLETAINDLIEQLSIVNENLKFKTFLSSHSIDLSDLLLTFVLFNCYSEVLTKDLKEKIPNVIRHFKFVSSIENVRNILGEAKQCNERKKPEPYVEKKKEEKNEKEKKEGKKEKKEGKKEKKDKAQKGEKKVEIKEEKKEEKKDEKKEEKKEEKKDEKKE